MDHLFSRIFSQISSIIEKIKKGAFTVAYIKSYWENKEERSKKARKHTEKMEKEYSYEIQNSVKHTKIYSVDFNTCAENVEKNTEIIVEDLDTVSAGKKYCPRGKTALLNFASYKNPGGMFLNGSKAQEECLCHESYLYNVLVQFQNTFYEWNNKHKNKALYLNRALYSPDVLFQEEWYCDVITCAAPNKSAAQKYQYISDLENIKSLRSRIEFMFDIAFENGVEVLILGAWGCGVFGQDPTEVATLFKELLETKYKQCFSTVVFAVPKGLNLDAFEKVFKN